MKSPLALLMLALALLLCAGKASAEVLHGPTSQSVALQSCLDHKAAQGTEVSPAMNCADLGPQLPGQNGGGCFYVHAWDAYHGYCWEPGLDPPNECASKPDLQGSVTGTWSTQPTQICSGGCTYYVAQGEGGSNGSGGYQISGTFKATGSTCTAGEENPFEAFSEGDPNGENDCRPVGGLSICKNWVTGKNCAITPRGTKSCWDSNELGPKVSPDQKEALNRQVAPTVPVAPPPLVNAETQTTSSSTQSSATATPTVNNYTITYSNVTGVSGTATGTSGSGSATGTAPTDNGTSGGSSEGSPHTASGGSCTAAYSCSGDPIMCAQLNEQRLIRCAETAGHGSLSGTGCDSPMNITDGDPVQNQTLKELHELNCAAKDAEGLGRDGDGEHDYGDDPDPDSVFAEDEVGTESLDMSGIFGGQGACPAESDNFLSALGGGSAFSAAAAICPGASILASFMLILGFIHAMWIIGGSAAKVG